MPTSPAPVDLNAAMAAYVAMFPSQERLRDHLEEVGRLDQFEDVQRQLRSAIATADDVLYAERGRIDWSAEWEDRFRARMCSHHPWLRTSGIARLLAYARWLCWHDGLNAPGCG